jgi:CheY-like chemotaxis protein
MAGRAENIMENQIQNMVRLVDDLLDVSRIMQRKIELRKERIELKNVLARAMETAQPAIDEFGHRLTVSLPPEPVWLDADLVRLAQVIANLLNNSAKYMDRGGQIWLSAECDTIEVIIRVRDAGIGISPELLPRIFDMFVQAEYAGTRTQGGLGIGLTLVHQLVKMHGGSVSAHSEGRGKGSEFVVRIPALPKTAPTEGAPPTQGQGAATPAIPCRKVLVVDDNHDAAETLALLLKLEGQDIRVSHDGAAALQAASDFRPEVVFLDIGMPGMNGYEVARRIRRFPGLENTVLIAMTGWGQEEDRRRSHEAGFDRHLVKPVEPAVLKELLRSAAGG